MDIFALWEKALQILQIDIGSMNYDTWIKDIRPISDITDSLYFEVPNDVTKTMLERRFFEQIKSALINAASEINFTPPASGLSPFFITKEEYSIISESLKTEEKAEVTVNNITLNSAFTFDNFVVGTNNNFAHGAAVAVAQTPGTLYNPLFIFGGTGLGKTHLMHAIGNHVLSKNPNLKITYVTSETFLNELVSTMVTAQDMNVLSKNKYNREAQEQFSATNTETRTCF